MSMGVPGLDGESAEDEPAAEESAASAASRNRFSEYQQPVRIFSHVVIWVVTLAPVVIEIQRGWRAIEDNATISMRAYQALSLHPPLLGQYSTLSQGTGHLLYDPGPLQYWLLALPVHIEPANGALWGSALLVGLVLSLSVEALWRSGDRWACGIVGLAVLNMACLIPTVDAKPSWNPYFGFSFMVASITLAWVVAAGSFGWWPWLVATASIAVQSESFFLYFALGLVIGAPLIATAVRKPARLRWLVVGVAVGAICWLPTAIQEVTGHQRNLTLLLGARGRALGLGFGLKNLALAGSPIPIWTKGDSTVPEYAALIANRSMVFGLLVLLMCLLVVVVAWRTQRKRLAALATLGLILSVAAVDTFAATPARTAINLWYLDRILWPIGILLWIIALWSLVEIGKAIAHSRRTSDRTTAVEKAPPLTAPWLVAIPCVLAAVAMAAFAIAELHDAATSQIEPGKAALASRIAIAVEKAAPRGPVSLSISPGGLQWFTEYGIVQGAAWQLTADGWRPGLPNAFSSYSGITYPPQIAWPKVRVSISGDTATANRIP